MKKTVRDLILSALFIALGLLLPVLTLQIPVIGQLLLPMHLPVLVCGFVCGAPLGAAVGLITPILRSVLFAMPPMFPVAVSMAFELAAYGFLCGFFYKHFQKTILFIYIDLILAMIGGRLVWGAVSLLFYTVNQNAFTWTIFINGALLQSVPGIILQIILIPPVVRTIRQAPIA